MSRTRTSRFKLALASLFLLALTSCRFGNHVENAPGLEAANGYYEMLVNSTIRMCATRPVVQSSGVTQDQRNCMTVPATHLDGFIQTMITNPVGFTYDSKIGIFWISPYDATDPKEGLPAIPF